MGFNCLYTYNCKTSIIGGKMAKKKVIVCEWFEEKQWGYDHALRVIESNHPRFIKGSRFDWGFANLATQEDGYELKIKPLSVVKKQVSTWH